MNRQLTSLCLLTASFVLGSIVAAQGQDITTGQLLHGRNRCDHVMAMIHRYGVNNSINEMAARGMFHHSPLGGVMVNESDFGDLQVATVKQIVDPNSTCGPRFAVLIHNNSCRNVCNFHVTAVAVLGRITPFSPNTTVRVGEIAAGETMQIELTLPIEALAMGNRNGQIIGLQRLVVAIDSLDQLAETNEANNLKAFQVCELPVLAVEVQTAVEGVAEVTAETPAAQVQQAESPAVATPPAAAPLNTGTPVTPSADKLRSAIKQLAVEQSTATAP